MVFMTIYESLKVSVFGLGIVFAVLTGLSLMVKIQSAIAALVEKSIDSMGISKNEIAECNGGTEPDPAGVSSGELRLVGLDEKTAAIIMAIISHESKIPIEELQFRSIKAAEGQITL